MQILIMAPRVATAKDCYWKRDCYGALNARSLRQNTIHSTQFSCLPHASVFTAFRVRRLENERLGSGIAKGEHLTWP